jgi:hypothetical protein
VKQQQWNTCDSPFPMLAFLAGKISDRKKRLFAVACCRRVAKQFLDRRSGIALRVCEQYADGSVSADKLNAAHEAAGEAADKVHYEGGDAVEQSAAATPCGLGIPLNLTWILENAAETAGELRDALDEDDLDEEDPFEIGEADEMRVQADLLRDIVGNPFRKRAVDSAWLRWKSGTIVKLAATIYSRRAFKQMPILADALEDAGCDNADMLAHCRGPGPHVRGCWVVDLLLGKS